MPDVNVCLRAETLIDLMAETKSGYSELLELARNKRPAIMKNNSEELNGIVSRDYKLMSLLKGYEKRRICVISETAKILGVSDADVTISLLAEHIDPETAAKLIDLRDDLLKVAESLKTENALNKSLLETHLSYTDMMLDLFGGTEDPINNFYGANGKTSDHEVIRNTVFDTNA